MIASKYYGDFVVAVVLLVLSLPFIALAALLVKLTSRGPVLYSQTRLGLHGREFKIHKIRTMIHNCEHQSGPRWSTPGDPRITRVGRFLRATHIDELPQLWNVLRGEMSLVGPRPERPEFAYSLEALIPLYGERLIVRPGVTGLAQVQLPPDSDLEGVRRKLAYDLHYIQRLSFWLDVKIVLATVLKVFGARFITLRKILGFPNSDSVRHEMSLLVGKETVAEEPLPDLQYQPAQV
jgi:lipopolysaccharide/colanic/teichoic acid biosynthesis glycosyltransferase